MSAGERRSIGVRATGGMRPSAHRSRTAGTSSLAARKGAVVAILAVLILSGLAASLSVPRAALSPSSPTAAAIAPAPTERSAGAVPAARPTTSAPGACAAGSSSPPSADAAPSAGPTVGAVHPAVLYNSQVEPYAELTGPYDYVAGGAAIRDQGYGTIDLTWPGAPSTANLVGAYMIWSIMDDAVPPDWGTLNGVNVSGTWSAYATPSPCWSPTFIYTFVADVTGDVVNGVNVLTAFPSGLTNGLDPWADPQIVPMAEGVSLVAVYSTDSAVVHEVTVYTGAETTSGGSLVETLNYTAAIGGAATTTYIVADGQYSGNSAIWNGTEIDANAFPGSDPKESTATWSYGNLSDTRTFPVTVSVGSTSTVAGVTTDGDDCVTWVGQVLSVPVAAAPPPYPVTFSEQGLPDGQSWSVTTNGTTESGTVAHFASAIDFELANGTYPFAVTPIPGFAARYTGSFGVDGGPVLLRVLFHAIVYPLTIDESGLPTDVEWSVVVSNISQALSVELTADAPASVLVDVGNGSYNLSALPSGLYNAVPKLSTVTVDAGPATATIDYVPPPLYPITFEEQGLPAGTTWGGEVYSNWGDFGSSTSEPSFSVDLPNATDDAFYPNAVAGYSSPDAFTFEVTAAPATITVTFAPLYSITISESGLPPDTYWTGELYGPSTAVYGSSAGTTISFTGVNGSYTFDVTPVYAYNADPMSASLTVDGGAAEASIVFSRAATYSLTITETGLPSGTSWGVTLRLPNETTSIGTSTTSSLEFSEPNGSYSFSVQSVAGFTADPSSGYPVISGADVSATITFTPVYAVNFTESGLPSGTDWYVYFDFAFRYSTTASIVFNATNGSDSFTAYTIGNYAPTPSEGTVVVDGANVSVPIVYASPLNPTYLVTFTESGLPGAALWSVVLNDVTESSTSTSIQFTEANGTFDFSIANFHRFSPDPSEGALLVAGYPVDQPVVFSVPPTTYSVTFGESGLPDDTDWSVTFAGTPSSSSDSSIAFTVENGTYSFAASSTGYTALPASGSLTVYGAALTETIDFTAIPPSTYVVTFTETGLPAETEWWVNVSGQSPAHSTAGSIEISLPAGSFTYTASSVDHAYTAAGGSGTVVDAPLEIPVKFSTHGGSSSPGLFNLPGSELDELGGGLAALFLAFVFLLLLRRRKKKASDGSTGSAGSGTGASPPPPP